jgi:cytochrome c
MRRALASVVILALAAGGAIAHGDGRHAGVPNRDEIAAGDPARGAAAFKAVCSACHTIEHGARRRVGPNLFGVAGGRIAQKEGYPYSEAFLRADIIWDDETLAAFLAAPMEVVAGTKMDWSVKDAHQIADIIAFLKAHR